MEGKGDGDAPKPADFFIFSIFLWTHRANKIAGSSRGGRTGPFAD
jgi:hypothetical protein